MKASNLRISSEFFKEKAFVLPSKWAFKLGIEDFLASWGWLDKLKKRQGLTNHYLSDKKTAISDLTVTEWITDLQV